VKEQVEFMAWLESLPDNLQDSTTAEALRAICEYDLALPRLKCSLGPTRCLI
jgi:hypothetical protein